MNVSWDAILDDRAHVMLAALRAARADLGRWPTAAEWDRSGRRPSARTFERHLGGWAEACRRAGGAPPLAPRHRRQHGREAAQRRAEHAPAAADVRRQRIRRSLGAGDPPHVARALAALEATEAASADPYHAMRVQAEIGGPWVGTLRHLLGKSPAGLCDLPLSIAR